jgi:hypothetical protein
MMHRSLLLLLMAGTMLAGCNAVSYTQRNNPADAYKDYKEDGSASVLGVGQPITQRQQAANATLSQSGQYDLDQIMQRVAGTYNLAVRWGNGVRKDQRQQVMMTNLTFDEARNYLEDVYNIQIIREGERRLLVMPSAAEPRIENFTSGGTISLAQAVRGLAEQCNFNLMINENKDKLLNTQVSTNLKDITCHDAFDALLNPHGMSLQDKGDYITITGLPQRQWTLNLYEPERSEEVEVNYSSEMSGSSDNGTQSAGGTNKVTIKYERNLWQDLENDLNALIDSNCDDNAEGSGLGSIGGMASAPTAAPMLLPPPSSSASGDPKLISGSTPMPAFTTSAVPTGSSGVTNCGYVQINPNVGLVQMRAPQPVLEEANDIIQRVEEVASRRLLLEARVIAVSRKRGFDQSNRLRFGGRLNAIKGEETNGGFTGSGSISSALAASLQNLSGTVSGQTVNLGGVFVRSDNLEAIIGALEQFGTTYELMHPTMELMDRQRATLIDGKNEKYFVVKTETTTGTATTTSQDVEERTQFLGMQFSATAQVSDNPSEPSTISLQIPITSLASTVNIPGTSSGSIAGVAPIANTRLIDQKIRIRDGEVKVIGGLTRTLAVDTESGVPILRDIPVAGKMLNSQNISYENVEFVVLLQVRRLN